jgi:hypothetical protein
MTPAPLFQSSVERTATKLAKHLRKAAKHELRARDRLAKGDTNIAPAPDQGAALTNLQAASFHADEATRHRRKARKCRSGEGMISLAHGEALARLHDQAADWHQAQARSLAVT